MKIKLSFLSLLMVIAFYACEKQSDQVKVTYRIVNFENGFTVYYKNLSDTLLRENVEGSYTLATPWKNEFMAEPGDIVYISMTDTTLESYSKVQILINGKVYKEKSRTSDRFMPVVVSGIIPFD
jgi:hypothetical protein